MSAEHGVPPFDETPTARRILAIDEEIAALERVRPKARYLWYGGALLAGILIWALTLLAAGSSEAELLFRVIVAVAIPSAVFGVQLARNTQKRHRLEHELDALIEEPGRTSERSGWDALPGPEAR
jgi:hypothetical protein